MKKRIALLFIFFWIFISVLPLISSAEENDLEMLMNASENQGNSLLSVLDWAGYFEVTYFVPSKQANKFTGFQLNRLDLFLSKKKNRWSFFSQLEYGLKARNTLEAASHEISTHNGGGECDAGKAGTETCELVENLENRIHELEEKNEEELNLGIEALWIEYIFSNYFGLRLGKQVTPFGWWNENHHPITALSTSRPTATYGLFPHEMIGFMGLGSVFLGDYALEYKLYLINDIKDTLQLDDNGNNKPIGANLKFKAPWTDRFDIGVSFLKGKDESGTLSVDHTVWGFNEYIQIKNFELLSEFGYQKKEPAANTENSSFFIQPAYSIPNIPKIGDLTLLYRYDKCNMVMHKNIRIHTFGFNIKPKPDIAIKTEYQVYLPHDKDEKDYGEFLLSLTMFF